MHERVESVWTDWFVENVCFNQSENLLLLYSPSLRQPIENSVNNGVSFATETTENLWTFHCSNLKIVVRSKIKFVLHSVTLSAPNVLKKAWLFPNRSLEKGSMLFTPENYLFWPKRIPEFLKRLWCYARFCLKKKNFFFAS